MSNGAKWLDCRDSIKRHADELINGLRDKMSECTALRGELQQQREEIANLRDKINILEQQPYVSARRDLECVITDLTKQVQEANARADAAERSIWARHGKLIEIRSALDGVI